MGPRWVTDRRRTLRQDGSGHWKDWLTGMHTLGELHPSRMSLFEILEPHCSSFFRDGREVEKLGVLSFNRGDLQLQPRVSSPSEYAKESQRTWLPSSSTSFSTLAITPMRTSFSLSRDNPNSHPSTAMESSIGNPLSASTDDQEPIML